MFTQDVSFAEVGTVGPVMFSVKGDTISLSNHELQDYDVRVTFGRIAAEQLFAQAVGCLDSRDFAALLHWNRNLAFDPVINFRDVRGKFDGVAVQGGTVRILRAHYEELVLEFRDFEEGATVEMTLSPYDLMDLMNFISKAV